MKEGHDFCAEHSGLKARMNLLIALMLVCITGVISLLGISLTMHMGLRSDMGLLHSTTMVTAEKVRHLENDNFEFKARLTTIERQFVPGFEGG